MLRQAQRQYPGDFWINYILASALRQSGPLYRDEAISFYRAAIAVRPRSVAAHTNLGTALHTQGKLDEAIAIQRKAIEIDPTYAKAHNNGDFRSRFAFRHRLVPQRSRFIPENPTVFTEIHQTTELF